MTALAYPPCWHGQTDELVAERWARAEAKPRDDIQWCGCCAGPAVGAICTRCELTELQRRVLTLAPDCRGCGGAHQGYTVTAEGWLCEVCWRGRVTSA